MTYPKVNPTADQQRVTSSPLTRQIGVLFENTLPLQTFMSLPWLIAGVFVACLPTDLVNVEVIDFQNVAALAIAFLAARLSGMSWNRLLDARFDKLNQRTRRRAIPSGRAQEVEVAFQAIVTLVLFFYATSYLPFLCRLLALPLGILLIGYSFTKRFTWLCHLALGAIYFILPLSAAAAFGSPVTRDLLLFSTACALTISGSDIIYSCQDLYFDKKMGLKSIPARFGLHKSLYIAATLHALALLLTLFVLISVNLSTLALGVAIVFGFLIFHRWRQVFFSAQISPTEVSSHFFPLALLMSFGSLMPLVVESIWRIFV